MPKLVLGKRGAEATTTQTWFVIIGLILAGIVVLGSLKKTVDDINGTTYEKNYFARDIALALDAVYAAPGDVEYTYSLRNYKFDVEVKDSKVFVKQAVCDANEVPGVYDFFGDTKKGLNKIVTRKADKSPEPMLIILTKKSNDVSLNDGGNAEVHDKSPCVEKVK